MKFRTSLVAASLALAAAVSLPAFAEHHEAKPSIVGIASTNADFETLTAALKAADLVGTLEDLLKPENKAKLTAILTYHVVPGDVKAADVVKLTGAKTVNGQDVRIAVEGGTVKVDGATVVATDIAASNGTIHVIDTVILPKG
jgi:uncharacterized surface protein with fasciclin (FAS1) repeats